MRQHKGAFASEPGSRGCAPEPASAVSAKGADPSRETYALGLMVEEMGESLKLIGKALRFGLDAPGPNSPEYRGLTAREMLPFEIGDLHAAIRYAAMAGVVKMSAANLAEQGKLAKLLDPLSRDAQGKRLAPDVSASGMQLSEDGLPAEAEGLQPVPEATPNTPSPKATAAGGK